LALTSPTGGGRSVGIVRSRTKATEFSLVYVSKIEYFHGMAECIHVFCIIGVIWHIIFGGIGEQQRRIWILRTLFAKD
jgi:hypothetical protein